jgi:predicted  nucleic acid-binding Zn-ribbon protein
MDLELAARELKMLAGKEGRTAAELDRAKYLMVQLKGMGMSNPEIVELTEGRWSESTIKGYTKGVRANDPEPWQSTTALFSEMQSRNLTLADVNQTMTIITDLEGMGSSLDNVVSFMEDLKRKGTSVGQLKEAIDLRTQLEQMGSSLGEIADFLKQLKGEDISASAFVSLLRDWHEAGLKSGDALSVLSYKSQLEQAGLDIDTMSHIAEAAGKFGGSAEVLEAVVRYGNLVALDQEAHKRQQKLDAQAAEMESRSREIDATDKKLVEVQNEIAAKEKALATYERLKAMGFDEKTLGALSKAAKKFGTPHQVLEAVNRFVDLAKIKANGDELREKAVRAKAELAGIERKVQGSKETYTEYAARNKAMLDQFEALNAKAIEVGRKVGNVEQQLKKYTSARDILDLLQNPVSAGYEQSLPLILIMVKSIGAWATVNQNKFKYYNLVLNNLQELMRYLGGI